MQVKRISILMFMVLLILVFGGCSRNGQIPDQSQKTEGLDQLNEIQVISREEGSGTRSAFAELAGFTGSDESKPDLTTDKALIAENAEEVCTLVRENVSAIGYISMGTEIDSGLKMLQINGIKAGMKEKAYPLGRTFYLAYCGQLNELEQDFLTYIHGAGQAIVSEAFIPIAKSSSFLSNKEKGTIKIGGSTSVAPLMEKLAEAYMELNPNAVITVEATDSGDGLTGAMSGELDLGMASRDLKDYEMELLDYEAIAKDNIAVIVNAGNPLENITLDQLKSIFTGEFSEWEELNR